MLKLSKGMAATALHLVTVAFSKGTSFRPWRAMDRHWYENIVYWCSHDVPAVAVTLHRSHVRAGRSRASHVNL